MQEFFTIKLQWNKFQPTDSSILKSQGNKNPDPVLRLIATVGQQKLVDAALFAIAENLKVDKKPSPFPRFGNEKLPYEFGRKGKFVYFVAAIKKSTERRSVPNDIYLEELIDNLFSRTVIKYPLLSQATFPTSRISQSILMVLDSFALRRLSGLAQWQNAIPVIE